MQRKIIPVTPVVPHRDAAQEACENAEPFALMVLGDSMLPEFAEGDIIANPTCHDYLSPIPFPEERSDSGSAAMRLP